MQKIEEAKIELIKRSIRSRVYKESFNVSGYSMYPFIKPNDKIKVEYKNQYNFGDIIIFQKRKLCIHRVLSKGKDKYYAKGDHNIFPDGYIDTNNILGSVVSINNISKKTSNFDRFIAFISLFELYLFVAFKKINNKLPNKIRLNEWKSFRPYYSLLSFIDKFHKKE